MAQKKGVWEEMLPCSLLSQQSFLQGSEQELFPRVIRHFSGEGEVPEVLRLGSSTCQGLDFPGKVGLQEELVPCDGEESRGWIVLPEFGLPIV